MKEFYANALFDGEELRCWVRGKDFTMTPTYLSLILNINRPMFAKSLVYDEMEPDLEIFRNTFKENLVVSSNGKSLGLSSLSPELKLLTTIMFHNLYPLSSTGYMHLGRALFLHDLIADKEIDVCSHIIHILVKTAENEASRNCLPFCCLMTKILKLKGVPIMEDEFPQSKQRAINISTLNAIKGHVRKNVKQESTAPQDDTSSRLHSYDEKLNNILASVQDISTKLSGLTTIMHSQHTQFETKFTSLQTQLDQIQRKLEEDDN